MQAQTGFNAPCKRFACKQVAATRLSSRRLLVCRASGTDSRVASVRVDMGSGVHKMDVALTDPNTRVVKARMEFPLGLVLESKRHGVFRKALPSQQCLHCWMAGARCQHHSTAHLMTQQRARVACKRDTQYDYHCASADVDDKVVVTEVSRGGAAAAANVST